MRGVLRAVVGEPRDGQALADWLQYEKRGSSDDRTLALLFRSIKWGVPYFLGRSYLLEPRALRELTWAIFLGGLVYVPLCLFEMRISPQLHKWAYGFRSSAFAMELRWGGYRPQVFMQSGLAVAMWMTSASLVGCVTSGVT